MFRDRGKENRQQLANYHANHADKLAKQRAYQEKNRDKYRTACSKWRETNPEKMQESKDKWMRNNPGWNAAKSMLRYSNKKQRTPPWLTREQKKEIVTFYDEARRLSLETGVKHVVDHIHPLQGVNLSGLHVPWNLQVLTSSENIRKFNRVDHIPEAWENHPKLTGL